MVKQILKLLAFLCAVVLTLSGLYQVVSWKDGSGANLSAMTQLYGMEDNLIDAVAVGSSHVYCGIAPDVIWQKTGISFFDMSISGQDRTAQYYHLKELLKTQSPKIVFFDLFGAMFDEHTVVSNEYRNVLNMRFSPDSIRQVISGTYHDKESLLMRWPIIHGCYRELNRFDFIDYPPNHAACGGMKNWTCVPQTAIENVFEDAGSVEISESNKSWIDSMFKLSQEHGFRLVPMVVPVTFTKENAQVLNGISDYIRSAYGTEILNFCTLAGEIGFDYSTDMVNFDHVNGYGANKISAYLADYLAAGTDLADHRGDAAYTRWDENVKWEKHRELAHELESADRKKAADYFALLSKPNHYMIVLCLDSEFDRGASYIQPLADAFGIDVYSHLGGATWVIRDNAVVYCGDNFTNNTLAEDINAADTLYIRPDAIFGERAQLTGTVLDTARHGLSVTVYDEYEQQLLWTNVYYK